MILFQKKRDNLLRKGKVQRLDVILTTRGTLGNSALFEITIPYSNIRINSGMVLLRCNQKELKSLFLVNVINSDTFSKQVKKYLSGSAQPQLPIKVLSNIKIPLPPMNLQKDIMEGIEKEKAHIESCKELIKINTEKIQQKVSEIWG